MSKCPKCNGRGVITYRSKHYPVPMTRKCECAEIQDKLHRMEKVWVGLSKVKPVKNSPLQKLTHQNVWIKSTHREFKRHLNSVVWKRPHGWFYSVETDRDLATAWLANIKQSGGEIYDGDVVRYDSKYLTLEDLTDPPELLVLLLGVKAARNAALPELVLDAIQGRTVRDKPTWIVEDSVNDPLIPGHLAYSDDLMYVLNQWENKVSLGDAKIAKPAQPKQEPRHIPISYPTPSKPKSSGRGKNLLKLD